MSGRVFDLITAENFAKWAEEQPKIHCWLADDKMSTVGCAIVQFVRSVGFQHPYMGRRFWSMDRKVNSEAPAWATAVAEAYDGRERSGPALAKIARENA